MEAIDAIFKNSGRSRVFIIAEIGKNFIQTAEDRPVLEYLENAKVLVRAAKDAGVDAVKFQTHNVEDEQLNLEVQSKARGTLSRVQPAKSAT